MKTNKERKEVIREEIIDAMLMAILIEMIRNFTHLDPQRIGLDINKLGKAYRMYQGGYVESPFEGIWYVWPEAYDNAVRGNAKYWQDEYGMSIEEVGNVVDDNQNNIDKRIYALLKPKKKA